MLNFIIEQTDKYIASKPKSLRKNIGQFFTSKETAKFMTSLFNMPSKDQIKVLDPGAGSGILSAAVIEEIEKQCNKSSRVELTCYETDTDIIPLLQKNLQYIKNTTQINLSYQIINDHYILSQSNDFSGSILASISPPKYDIIISNPPYFKLPKDSPEVLAMQTICYGQPNIYFLFAAMSLFNLMLEGDMVYIIPRSWTSGAYFVSFRKFILTFGKITDIHIFTKRDNIFDMDQILQETMIIKIKKNSYCAKYDQYYLIIRS